ncbi:MAG: hypothetical protein OZ928_08830 [Polyangiaceae bacterium]|nr:hypothetical protein [Polyangiaceae bacterium]
MDTALTVVALLSVALALIALALFLPVRWRLTVQGRGEPDGAWVLAGGTSFGPLALSGVGARGVPGVVQLHLFGRRVWQRALARLRSGYARVARFIDPIDFCVFVVTEPRHARIEALDCEVDFSFEDIITTGKLLGALYALGGALPPPVSIRPNASWESLDRGSLALSATVRVRPGLLALGSLWYLVSHLEIRERPRAARGAADPP